MDDDPLQPHWDFARSDREAELSRLARVNKTFHAVASPLLYQRLCIRVSSRDDDLIRLGLIMRSCLPNRCTAVKAVTIQLVATPVRSAQVFFLAFLGNLPCLESVQIIDLGQHAVDFPDLFALVRQRARCLILVKNCSLASFCDLEDGSLARLSLSRVNWTPRLWHEIISLRQLQSLELEGMYRWEQGPDAAPLVESLSNLRNLDLAGAPVQVATQLLRGAAGSLERIGFSPPDVPSLEEASTFGPFPALRTLDLTRRDLYDSIHSSNDWSQTRVNNICAWLEMASDFPVTRLFVPEDACIYTCLIALRARSRFARLSRITFQHRWPKPDGFERQREVAWGYLLESGVSVASVELK